MNPLPLLHTFVINVVGVRLILLLTENCLFSYLIGVSSKLFLSQSAIFNFCASNSVLHPTTGEGEEGVSKQCMVWSGFRRNTKLENTIPKLHHL